LQDAEPREVFIIACLLVPIIGFGFYPKMLTQIYDATTQQLTARLRDSVPTLAQSAVAKAVKPVLPMTAPPIGKR
jgi:NAD(P)H-quinone oxidoreductase subunit 4